MQGIAPALVCSALEQTDRERTDIASDALNQSSGVNSRAHRPTFDGEHDEHENDEPSAESAADSDFLAALALTRKRRIGPFAASSSASASAAPESTTRAEYQRSLEKLVRAGFSFVTAKRALATRPDVAASFFARRDL